MATIVDALVVTLGLDSSGLDKGAEKSKKTMLNVAKFTVAAAVAFKFLKSTVEQFVSAGDDIGRFANLNGLAVGEVQTLDNSIKVLGGNVGEMRGTIARLNKDMTGLYPVNPFAAMGVRATDANNKIKPMTTILTEVAGKMEGLSAAKQADIGEKLGLDQSTIELLQKGEKGVAALFAKQKELGMLTKDDTKIARKMNEAMASLKIAWNASGASIARVLTPAITWFTEKLTDLVVWMRKNETIVKAFFATIATVITVLVLPALISMAIAVLAATWPFILLGAVIVAVSAFIAALIDDFIAYRDGGKSALSDVWKFFDSAFKGMESVVMAFWEFVKPVWEGFVALVKNIMNLVVGIFTGDTDKIKSSILSMMEGLKEIWMGYYEYVTGIFDKMTGYIGDKVSSVASDITGKLSGAVDFLNPFSDDEDEKMVKASVNSRKPGAINSTSQNQKTSNMTQNIGNVTVQTAATDAPGIAKDLGVEIKRNASLVNQAERGMM